MIVWGRQEVKQPSSAGRQAIGGAALLVFGLVAALVLVAYLFTSDEISRELRMKRSLEALGVAEDSVPQQDWGGSVEAQSAALLPYRCEAGYVRYNVYASGNEMQTIMAYYTGQARSLGWQVQPLDGGAVLSRDAKRVDILVRQITDDDYTAMYPGLHLDLYNRDIGAAYVLATCLR